MSLTGASQIFLSSGESYLPLAAETGLGPRVFVGPPAAHFLFSRVPSSHYGVGSLMMRKDSLINRAGCLLGISIGSQCSLFCLLCRLAADFYQGGVLMLEFWQTSDFRLHAVSIVTFS